MQVEFRHRGGRVILQVAVDVTEPCGRKLERGGLNDDLMSTSYTQHKYVNIELYAVRDTFGRQLCLCGFQELYMGLV
jgi:hypothetical protein